MPTVIVDAVHAATFVHDELDECIDIERRVTIPPGETWRPDPPGTIDAEDREVLTLSQPCAEAFVGRTIMATCTMTPPRSPRDGEPVAVTFENTITSHMYRFESSLRGDRRMHDCLRDGGSWEALREDSDEYRRAELEANVERLRSRR